MIKEDRANEETAQISLELIGKWGFRYACLVGSCAIQGEGNDIDVMVVIEHEHMVDPLVVYLTETGWIEQCGDEFYGTGDFRSLRNGDVNILLVWDDEVSRRWVAAVEVCKYIGTKSREQRVAIHQIIMDGRMTHELDESLAPPNPPSLSSPTPLLGYESPLLLGSDV